MLMNKCKAAGNVIHDGVNTTEFERRRKIPLSTNDGDAKAEGVSSTVGILDLSPRI